MSEFTGPKVCQHCGYYAQVRRRTVDQGWHVAEWGECRKADLAKTGVMTPENETCDDFTPDPRRWPNVQAVPAAAVRSESTQKPSPPLGTSA